MTRTQPLPLHQHTPRADWSSAAGPSLPDSFRADGLTLGELIDRLDDQPLPAGPTDVRHVAITATHHAAEAAQHGAELVRRGAEMASRARPHVVTTSVLLLVAVALTVAAIIGAAARTSAAVVTSAARFLARSREHRSRVHANQA